MINQWLVGFRRWMEVRSAVREMARLDDRTLEDIGVSRAMIRAAAEYGLR